MVFADFLRPNEGRAQRGRVVVLRMKSQQGFYPMTKSIIICYHCYLRIVEDAFDSARGKAIEV